METGKEQYCQTRHGIQEWQTTGAHQTAMRDERIHDESHTDEVRESGISGKI